MIPVSGSPSQAIVDINDSTLLTKYCWHLHDCGYARTSTSTKKMIYMHRMILGATASQEVDHINGNRFDNRKSNLRFVNRTINNLNRHKKQNGTTSQFIGVHYDKQTCRWRAEIGACGRRFRLGRFDTEQEASRAYIKKRNEIMSNLIEIKQ